MRAAGAMSPIYEICFTRSRVTPRGENRTTHGYSMTREVFPDFFSDRFIYICTCPLVRSKRHKTAARTQIENVSTDLQQTTRHHPLTANVFVILPVNFLFIRNSFSIHTQFTFNSSPIQLHFIARPAGTRPLSKQSPLNIQVIHSP